MPKFPLALLLAFALGVPSQACSFCAGGLTARRTLREQALKADAIVLGTLKNAKIGEDIRIGTTEFHFDDVVKTSADFKAAKLLVLPRYIPAIEQQLFFFGSVDGKPDIVASVPGSPAVAAYIRGGAKLKDQPAARLGFFFNHLDSADATVAAGIFDEFWQFKKTKK